MKKKQAKATPKALPKVMIAIPTNEEKSFCLTPFLTGLKNITYKNTQILMTDDSVDDTYMNMLRDIGFQVDDIPDTKGTEEWRQRVCNARNYIAKKFLESDCDYLFFLDSDVVTPPYIIERLLEVFEKNPDCTMAAGVYFFINKGKMVPVAFPYFSPEFQNLHKLFSNFDLQPIRPICPEYLNLLPARVVRVNSTGMGCNMLSRRGVELGGRFYYKPEFISTEDLWYCLDMNEKGGAVYVDTGCLCTHYPTDRPHYGISEPKIGGDGKA